MVFLQRWEGEGWRESGEWAQGEVRLSALDTFRSPLDTQVTMPQQQVGIQDWCPEQRYVPALLAFMNSLILVCASVSPSENWGQQFGCCGD